MTRTVFRSPFVWSLGFLRHSTENQRCIVASIVGIRSFGSHLLLLFFQLYCSGIDGPSLPEVHVAWGSRVFRCLTRM